MAPVLRREHEVYASHPQFYVGDPEAGVEADVWDGAALERHVGVAPGMVAVGAVGYTFLPVAIEVWESEPPLDEGWDHVVEAPLELTPGASSSARSRARRATRSSSNRAPTGCGRRAWGSTTRPRWTAATAGGSSSGAPKPPSRRSSAGGRGGIPPAPSLARRRRPPGGSSSALRPTTRASGWLAGVARDRPSLPRRRCALGALEPARRRRDSAARGVDARAGGAPLRAPVGLGPARSAPAGCRDDGALALAGVALLARVASPARSVEPVVEGGRRVIVGNTAINSLPTMRWLGSEGGDSLYADGEGALWEWRNADGAAGRPRLTELTADDARSKYGTTG